MDKFTKSNRKLVYSLVKKGYIRSKSVKEAMLKVDRKFFVPKEYREDAYQDTPLPIPGNVTISAPHK